MGGLHRWESPTHLRTEVSIVGVQGLECPIRLVAAHDVAAPRGAKLFGVGS